MALQDMDRVQNKPTDEELDVAVKERRLMRYSFAAGLLITIGAGTYRVQSNAAPVRARIVRVALSPFDPHVIEIDVAHPSFEALPEHAAVPHADAPIVSVFDENLVKRALELAS